LLIGKANFFKLTLGFVSPPPGSLQNFYVCWLKRFDINSGKTYKQTIQLIY
jgi:hypothetical protein